MPPSPPTAATPPAEGTPGDVPRTRRRRSRSPRTRPTDQAPTAPARSAAAGRVPDRGPHALVPDQHNRVGSPDLLTMTFQLGQQQERLNTHDTFFKQHDQRISSLERIAVETKEHLDAQDERAEERERVAAARAEERDRGAAARDDAFRSTIAGLVTRLDTEDTQRKARTDETVRRLASIQTWTKGFVGTAAGGGLYYIGLQTWPRVLTGDVRNVPTLVFALIVGALIVAWMVAGHIKARTIHP